MDNCQRRFGKPREIKAKLQERIQGGGVLGVRSPPPPLFWGTPKLQKERKTSRACTGLRLVLVLNS